MSTPKSQRFKSQRLQDANATISQTLTFYKSQRFSATKEMIGKCEGSRLVGGTWLVVFPDVLTPYRLKNTTSRDPYPPWSRGTLLPAGNPLLHLFGRGNGQGVPARGGVLGRGFLIKFWFLVEFPHTKARSKDGGASNLYTFGQPASATSCDNPLQLRAAKLARNDHIT